MLGQTQPKRRKGLAGCGFSLVTFALVIGGLAAGCFLLCSAIFLLNGGTLSL